MPLRTGQQQAGLGDGQAVIQQGWAALAFLEPQHHGTVDGQGQQDDERQGVDLRQVIQQQADQYDQHHRPFDQAQGHCLRCQCAVPPRHPP